jgi:hypothetical protein
MSGPEAPSEQGKYEPTPAAAPPGYFLSPDLESDCARFLDELRARLRRRAEAEHASLPSRA